MQLAGLTIQQIQEIPDRFLKHVHRLQIKIEFGKKHQLIRNPKMTGELLMTIKVIRDQPVQRNLNQMTHTEDLHRAEHRLIQGHRKTRIDQQIIVLRFSAQVRLLLLHLTGHQVGAHIEAAHQEAALPIRAVAARVLRDQAAHLILLAQDDKEILVNHLIFQL